MNQVEFEKRRVAQIKVLNVLSGGERSMKIIDLIELLLELEPGRVIVLPGCFVAALENPLGGLLSLLWTEENEA